MEDAVADFFGDGTDNAIDPRRSAHKHADDRRPPRSHFLSLNSTAQRNSTVSGPGFLPTPVLDISSRFSADAHHSNHGHGSAGHKDGPLDLLPPQTSPADCLLNNKDTALCSATPVAAVPVSFPCRASRTPAWASVITINSPRDLGIDPQGGAQEEDITHEEEAQADGRQGDQGRELPVQVPRVRRDQADALSLPALRSKTQRDDEQGGEGEERVKR